MATPRVSDQARLRTCRRAGCCAGYASALDYLYALVISDRLSRNGTSLTTKEKDGLPGKARTIAALRRFEGLASADLKFNRDKANER